MIYFIQQGAGGPVKIGLADDPRVRLASLQTANPVKLCLLAVTEGDIETEQWYHRLFSEGRIHSEWFRWDTPGLQEHITKLQEGALEPIVTDWHATEEESPLCQYCMTEPIPWPRRNYCSDDCSQLMRRERKEATA